MPEIVASLGYLDFFGLTVVSFLLLYFSFTTIAYKLFVVRHNYKSYQAKDFRPGQIKKEIERSLVSILMFGLLSFWMCWALKNGIYKFNFSWQNMIF